MEDMIATLIGYATVFFMTFFGLNFLTGGFILTYIRVKASRGRYVLVKLNTRTDTYFKIGEVEKENLIIQRRKSKFWLKKKDVLTFTIPENIEPFWRALGVTWVEVEESKGTLVHRGQHIGCYDVTTTDEYIDRALKKPSLEDKQKLLLIILVIVGLLAAGGVWVGWLNLQAIEALDLTVGIVQ